MSRIHQIFVVILCCLFANCIAEGDAPTASKTAKTLARIADNRQTNVAELLTIVRTSRGTSIVEAGHKAWAIRLLGEYRAVGALDCLVENLDFCPNIGFSEYNPLTRYPAAEALVQIGQPAIPKIYSRCGLPMAEEEVALCAWVVYMMHREDHRDVGLFQLEHQKKKADVRGGQRAENLNRIIEFYRQIDIRDNQTWPEQCDERAKRTKERGRFGSR